MMKFSVFTLLFLIGSICFSQDKLEREHRIKKIQFPTEAQAFVGKNVKNANRFRFYKTIDTAQTLYTVKFKKDKLKYYIDFNKNGTLKSIGFRIKEIDIPSETFSKIKSYLSTAYDKIKIRRMFQQYPMTVESSENQVLKDAFQNMILPSNTYKLLTTSKQSGKKLEQEMFFDAEGNLKSIRKTLPANYDRVLY